MQFTAKTCPASGADATVCEQAVAGTCNAVSGACDYPTCDGTDALACEDDTSGTCNGGACEYELNCPASGASECEDGDAAACEDDGTCTVRPSDQDLPACQAQLRTGVPLRVRHCLLSTHLHAMRTHT